MLRLVICVLICVFSFAHAQNGFSMQDSLDADLNLVYRKEQYTRFNIHVRGYGIAFGFGGNHSVGLGVGTTTVRFLTTTPPSPF